MNAPGPCEGLLYDIEHAIEASEHLILSEHIRRRHSLLIVLSWHPSPDAHLSPSLLRRHFYATFGEVFGAQTSVSEQQRERDVAFHVICGTDRHTEVFEVRVRGAAVSAMQQAMKELREAEIGVDSVDGVDGVDGDEDNDESEEGTP